MRQIVLDTETTGLYTHDGHRIIELGCIELINRKMTGVTFHHYLNPQRTIDEGAQKVHGITNEFLENKPLFSEIADSFLEFVHGAELIIHNAPFDVGFIDYEFSVAKKNPKPLAEYCRIFDTLLYARKLHVGQRNSLDALCKRYGIDNSGREWHGAMLDAHLLAEVYLAMTGGQGSLFDHLQIPETLSSSTSFETQKRLESRRLVVLEASSLELASHQEYLDFLSKKGKCLWFD